MSAPTRMLKRYRRPSTGICAGKKTGFLFHGRSKHLEGFDVTSPFKIPWQVCTASAG